MANTTDVEVVRYVADVSALDAGQRQLEATLMKSKASALALNRSLKENVQSSKLYKDRLAELDAELAKNGKLSDASEKEQKKLKVALDNVSKSIKTQQDTLKGLEKQTQVANARLKETPKALKDVEEQGKKTSNMFSGLGKILIAFFSFNQIKQFVKDIFDVTAQFQKFEAVLTNTLGSNSLARKALQDIQQFAKETPFGVQEVTGAFVKLANQGFTPTIVQLRKLGDLVASTGKTFDQLAEALLDAQQGQYRRLLEFGIRAEKQGDKVSFTFKGVKTVVDDNAESIRNFIVSLGDFEGVAGSMAAISQTLEGRVSNLGDSFDRLFNTLGQQGSGAFSGAIQSLNDFVNFLATVLRSQEQILGDNTQKFIDKQAQLIEKGNEAQIQAIQKTGASRVEAERAVFDRISQENAELAELTLKNNTYTQAQITADTQKLAEMRAAGQFGIEEKTLAQSIQQNKKILRVSEANYATQIFLRDDYASRVKTIDQKIQTDSDAALALRLKNAKALADAEAKEFALQEQQRRAYNDFSISLIDDQFDREAAQLREQFFRKIEDSKKNIGLEITTNSEEYTRLNNELLKKLQENEVKRKEFEDKLAAERSKAIIDRVNKEIAAQESAGNNVQANELKAVRDSYEAQLAAGVKYTNAKEQLDNNIAATSFQTKNNTLNSEIELLNKEIFANQGNNDVLIALNKTLNEKINEQDLAAFNERERLRQKELEQIKIQEQIKAEVQKAAINVVSAALEASINLRQQEQTEEIEADRAILQKSTDEQIALIDKRVKLGYLSEQQGAALKDELDKKQAKKEQDLKLRQFNADKQAATSRALIGIAQGVINAFATLPFPAALIAAAGIAVLGAINIASIRSAKPPKFKDGVIDLQGKGTGTSDSIDAKLSRGESVMTAKETKQYKPEFEAMRAGTFEQLMKQKYSTESMSFLPYEKEQKRKQAEYKATNDRDRARRDRENQLDLSKMEKLTRRNGTVGIKNAEEIGKAVARNLPSNTRYSA